MEFIVGRERDRIEIFDGSLGRRGDDVVLIVAKNDSGYGMVLLRWSLAELEHGVLAFTDDRNPDMRVFFKNGLAESRDVGAANNRHDMGKLGVNPREYPGCIRESVGGAGHPDMGIMIRGNRLKNGLVRGWMGKTVDNIGANVMFFEPCGDGTDAERRHEIGNPGDIVPGGTWLVAQGMDEENRGLGRRRRHGAIRSSCMIWFLAAISILRMLLMGSAKF